MTIEGQRLIPVPTAESRHYWERCNAGELQLQRCTTCQAHQFYPRCLCSHCGATELEWVAVSGYGHVATFTVVRHAFAASYADKVPYVVAVVRLDEGPQLLSNVIDCDPETVRVGMPLEVAFERLSDEIAIPVFRPRG